MAKDKFHDFDDDEDFEEKRKDDRKRQVREERRRKQKDRYGESSNKSKEGAQPKKFKKRNLCIKSNCCLNLEKCATNSGMYSCRS